jgi:two-component system LytT family response regulator
MAGEHKLRVLIVDDEPAARKRLEDLLAAAKDVEVVGSASTGKEAVAAAGRLAPDLMFLDIQMPGMTGVEVVEAVGPGNMPAVIFVTAYDQYAIQAFDVAALDYLLKPFDDERFEQALSRARDMIALHDVNNLRGRLVNLIRAAHDAPAETSPRYLERIAVEMRGQLRIIPVERIDFIQASAEYAELHVGDDTFLIREQMQSLETRLDPANFFRIHRSTIVQLDRIEVLKYSEGGDYSVRLKDDRMLKVSRTRWEDLQKRLGIDREE